MRDEINYKDLLYKSVLFAIMIMAIKMFLFWMPDTDANIATIQRNLDRIQEALSKECVVKNIKKEQEAIEKVSNALK
ncbi:MAG: hypothetical protein PHV37_00600 [Candidatus Gastranaerophilales bacterium]|nr:hypothetical protein [Candidatus Gastranaerophilales bacterium]